MARTIQVRRDIESNWITTNPVLKKWEFWYITDTNKLKIWDWVKTWTQLPNFNNDWVDWTNWADWVNWTSGTNWTNWTNWNDWTDGTNWNNWTNWNDWINWNNWTDWQWVPTGWATWQVLSKIDWTNFNTEWIAPGSGWWWGWFMRDWQWIWTQSLWVLTEWIVAKATTLDKWAISLWTAPTWADFIVSVSKSTDNWATYWVAETVVLTAWNKSVANNLSWVYAKLDWMKIEITQIWSTIAGQDLLLSINWN